MIAFASLDPSYISSAILPFTTVFITNVGNPCNELPALVFVFPLLSLVQSTLVILIFELLEK